MWLVVSMEMVHVVSREHEDDCGQFTTIVNVCTNSRADIYLH